MGNAGSAITKFFDDAGNSLKDFGEHTIGDNVKVTYDSAKGFVDGKGMKLIVDDVTGVITNEVGEVIGQADDAMKALQAEAEKLANSVYDAGKSLYDDSGKLVDKAGRTLTVDNAGYVINYAGQKIGTATDKMRSVYASSKYFMDNTTAKVQKGIDFAKQIAEHPEDSARFVYDAAKGFLDKSTGGIISIDSAGFLIDNVGNQIGKASEYIKVAMDGINTGVDFAKATAEDVKNAFEVGFNAIGGFFNGLADKVKKLLKEIEDLIKEIENIGKSIPGLIISWMKKSIIKPINDLFNKLLKPVLDFFNKMEKIFTVDIPNSFKELELAFKTIGDALGDEFTAFGLGIAKGSEDIGWFVYLFKYAIEYVYAFLTKYIWSRLECAINKIKNFRFCSLYYFLFLVSQFFYLILITIPLWFLKVSFGLDLSSIVDTIQGFVNDSDQFVFDSIGYHLIKFSDETTNRCFKCSSNQKINEEVKTIPEFLETGESFVVKRDPEPYTAKSHFEMGDSRVNLCLAENFETLPKINVTVDPETGLSDIPSFPTEIFNKQITLISSDFNTLGKSLKDKAGKFGEATDHFKKAFHA
jgi:tetrahydromethanopterin S-methyltransferase subunit B